MEVKQKIPLFIILCLHLQVICGMINCMNNSMLFNKNQKSALLSEIESGRLSHAYLVEGGEGSGKTYFCSFMAKAILCKGNKKPCDVCNSCVKANSSSHPDIFYFFPDKKATMGVETVREIKKSVYLTPNDGDKKVYIIDEAQKMTVQAQNALLKFLEEPPESSVFFIIADKKESMLPTVSSRTRIVSLTPASDEDMREFLAQSSKSAKNEDIEQTLRMAEGSPGRALKLLNKDFSKQKKLCLDFVPLLLGKSNADVMAFLVSMKLNREGLKEFFNLLLTSLSDIMNVKFGVEATRLLTSEEAKRYSVGVTDRRLAYLSDLTMEAIIKTTENANINLLLTAFSAKL